MITSNIPGTTRDAISVPFCYQEKDYTLIDTAGVRKRGKVTEAIEKFSVIKTLQAIEQANVVILILSAHEGIVEQDAHLADYILQSGRALVVAINKWDGLDDNKRRLIKQDFTRRLAFLSFAEFHYISALKQRGLNELLKSTTRALRSAFAKLPTHALNQVLAEALIQQSPARIGGLRPKLRYAHQGGSNPPTIVIHGNRVHGIADSYMRFLERYLQQAFELVGTPLRVSFKEGANPYVNQNETPRPIRAGLVSMRRRKMPSVLC